MLHKMTYFIFGWKISSSLSLQKLFDAKNEDNLLELLAVAGLDVCRQHNSIVIGWRTTCSLKGSEVNDDSILELIKQTLGEPSYFELKA